MDIFNDICGVCSIVGLLVSLFTASKVVKISQTINCGNKSKEAKVNTKVSKSEVCGDMNITNIIMLQDSERKLVVTHNADIRSVSYFTGRETELQELRQRVEEGRKSVLVSGMGGIGKTHICRKFFEEYTNRHADGEDISFCHIGYIEYDGDMGNSLQSCLKYKKQDNPEQNQEAAWRELEYLAADGKLLLFVEYDGHAVSLW